MFLRAACSSSARCPSAVRSLGLAFVAGQDTPVSRAAAGF